MKLFTSYIRELFVQFLKLKPNSKSEELSRSEALRSIAPVQRSLHKGEMTRGKSLASYVLYLATIKILFCVCLAHARQQGLGTPVATGVAFQNSYAVTGKILSATTNEPLDGATISIQGKQAKVLTNADGAFRMLASDTSGVLLISFVGYQSAEINFNRREAGPFTIQLESNGTQLDEVQVSTGYQTLPKERVTGSFAMPDQKMFENRVSTDVISRLEGITSGLVFNAAGTRASNDNGLLNIRGLSTIYANNQPLIVVDNFPYEGDINNINPNDIENITVLKDAAASSIWGVRAGNGVIVITTKGGKSSEKLSVSVNTNLTVSEMPDLTYDPNFISSADFVELEKFLFDKGFYNGRLNDISYPVISPVVALLADPRRIGTGVNLLDELDLLKRHDVRDDFRKYFYRNPIKQQHALSFSGKTERNNYYLSLGYDNNRFQEIANDQERITVMFDNTFHLSRALELKTGINFIRNDMKQDNTLANTSNAFMGGIYPYARLVDNAGQPLSIIKGFSPFYTEGKEQSGFLNWQFYPIDELNKGLHKSEQAIKDMRLYTSLNYRFLNNLRAELRYQYQHSQTGNDMLAKEASFYARNEINKFAIVDADKEVVGHNLPIGSIWMRGSGLSVAHNARGQLNYDQQWGVHTVTAIGGIELREVKTTMEASTFYGYNDETGAYGVMDHKSLFRTNPAGAAAIPSGLSSGGTINRFRSYFVNAAYTYNDLYTLSASARIDQSNFFGVKANQRSVPLWSVGAKWRLNRESFYHLDFLPDLNLRATYGFSGNLDNSVTALTTFYLSGPYAPLTNAIYSSVSNYGNERLRWEKTRMLNLGADFAFSKGVLSGSVDFFFKRGKDLMGNELLPPSSGLTQFRGNYAAMSGKGIDVNLQAKLINQGIKWDMSGLFSWAQDKVTEFSAQARPNQLLGDGKSLSPFVGKPVYGLYSLKWAGLDPETGDPLGYDAENAPSKNYGALNNPASLEEIAYHGPARPIYFGGWRNTFRYGAAELSFNLSYKLGYYFRRQSINYNNLFSSYNVHQDYAWRWQAPGDEAYTNVPAMVYPANQNRDSFYSRSELLAERGDHIRLQDISLAYNFHNIKALKSNVNNLQIYLYANNLGVLWKATKTDLDPDFPVGGIPNPKSIALGLKANF